jgi:hypothetical protein
MMSAAVNSAPSSHASAGQTSAHQTPTNQAPVGGAGYGYQQTTYQAPVQEGVLGAAWRDITGTQGWFKKVLFLCLVGCVPILNLSVEGYALRWSRELAFGERNPLPKEVFKKKEILTGFRAWLVKISLGFVFGILALLAVLLVAGLFGMFSYQAGTALGMLVAAVLGIGFFLFYLPMINVSVMRMTVVDYLEGALNLPKVASAFKRSMGGAIGATVVPPLVIGAIVGLVFFVFAFIIAAMTQGASNSVAGGSYGYGYGMGSYLPLSMMRMGAGVMFCYLLLQLFSMMMGTFGMLLTWRAMGHWLARNASEWAHESDEEGVMRMVDSRFAESGPAAGGAPASAHQPSAASPRVSAAAPVGYAPYPAPSTPAPQSAPSSTVNAASAPSAPTYVEQPAPTTVAATRSAGDPTSDTAAPADPTSQLNDRKTIELDPEPRELSLRRRRNGEVYRLDHLPATLGKGAAADIIIEGNESISRVHARVSLNGDDFVVEDLNATNGTQVNGMPVQPGMMVLLSDGDVLRLSDEDFDIAIR